MTITLADLAINGEAEVHLIVTPRHEVASRVWYTLEWTDDDGQRHKAEASTLALLMQRANEIETNLRAREVNLPCHAANIEDPAVQQHLLMFNEQRQTEEREASAFYDLMAEAQ
jgi:hypothetical protein